MGKCTAYIKPCGAGIHRNCLVYGSKDARKETHLGTPEYRDSPTDPLRIPSSCWDRQSPTGKSTAPRLVRNRVRVTLYIYSVCIPRRKERHSTVLGV